MKTDKIPKKKFKRGDVVRIAKDLGPSMSHFESDQEAIITESDYCEGWEYGLITKIGSESCWYEEWQLTFIRYSKRGEAEKWIKKGELRDQKIRDKNNKFWASLTEDQKNEHILKFKLLLQRL